MTKPKYMLLQIVLCWMPFTTAVNIVLPGDPSMRVFPPETSQYSGKVQNVTHILLDERNKKVYVASLNTLFSVPLDLKKLDKWISLNPEKELLEKCMQYRRKTSCQNVIKSLEYDLKGRVYVCGTNALDPKCYRFQRSTLMMYKNYTIPGYLRSPSHITFSSTTLFLDPFIFTATQKRNEYAIWKFKPLETSYTTRTKDNVKIMNKPHFISSYSFDDSGYAYFFFREIAIESTQRKFMYSRVARVCKYDNGHDVLAEKLFLSFLKSHLVCKKSGANGIDIYYDELQSTYMMEVHDPSSTTSETFIYGIFSISSELATSAICRYHVKDIVNILSTSPLAKEENSKWKAEPFSTQREELSRPLCNDTAVIQGDDINTIPEATQTSLLYNEISPYDQGPMFTINVGLRSLVVDDVHLQNDSSDIGFHMVFASSADGIVYKILINSTGKGVGNIVEKLQPFKTRDSIYTLKKSKDVIYAGGMPGIASLTVQRCESFLLCSNCVDIKDPYCAWSKSKGKCTEAKKLLPQDRIQDMLKGNVNLCPIVERDFKCDIQITLSIPGYKAGLKCIATTTEREEKAQVIGWIRSNQHIFKDTVYDILTADGGGQQELIINKFTESFAGKYQCIVGLGNDRKACNVTLEAPTTQRSRVTTSQSSNNKTKMKATTTTTPAGVPYIGDPSKSYFTEFIAMTVLFIVVFPIALILLCLLLLLRHVRNSEYEIDGEAANGKGNGYILRRHFAKKYDMKRKDSAKKELLQKKNKNQVYALTTLEMNEKTVEEDKKVPSVSDDKENVASESSDNPKSSSC